MLQLVRGRAAMLWIATLPACYCVMLAVAASEWQGKRPRENSRGAAAAAVAQTAVSSLAREDPESGEDDKAALLPTLGGAAFMPAVARPWRFTPSDDADDGTEINGATWHPDGRYASGNNCVGSIGLESCNAAFRFRLDPVLAGQQFACARLVLPAGTAGQIEAGATIQIIGVDLDGVGNFAALRPSQMPKTEAVVEWVIESPWPASNSLFDCTPLERHSPDIADIINEILARPGWGTGPSGKTLALVVRDGGADGDSYVTCEDLREQRASCPGKLIAPALELYPDLRSTFLAPGLLGCPTDHSVTLNAYSLMATEACIAYGTTPNSLAQQSEIISTPGGTPIEILIDGLDPDTRYYYQFRYRAAGGSAFSFDGTRTFHTQRARGSSFVFGIQADSHLHEYLEFGNLDSRALYKRSVANLSADQPDFLIDMGDTFFCEAYVGRDVFDYEEALQRVLAQRPFLDRTCHSAPFFLVLGNHEGEQGWRLDGTPENVAVWATNARKLLYPLPVPDSFYSGNVTAADFVGLRESYYSWEWGDALFVVLDPFWHTMTNPHGDCHFPGSGDNWDWTLGRTQYDWFCQVLAESDATFKMVFAHHVTGGINTYGRGGIEAASHALGGMGSFEWGGESIDGNHAFNDKRPGWGLPIHDVMVANGVKIFFHGHDHVFVKQTLDGIVYQECPQPGDSTYSMGMYNDGGYVYGDALENAGHLRVTVEPTQLRVEYVRAFLPGEGANGDVAYSYTIFKPMNDTDTGRPPPKD